MITLNQLIRDYVFQHEPVREIIDVEYEDISDLVENDRQLVSDTDENHQLLITSNENADTDNK